MHERFAQDFHRTGSGGGRRGLAPCPCCGQQRHPDPRRRYRRSACGATAARRGREGDGTRSQPARRRAAANHRHRRHALRSRRLRSRFELRSHPRLGTPGRCGRGAGAASRPRHLFRCRRPPGLAGAVARVPGECDPRRGAQHPAASARIDVDGASLTLRRRRAGLAGPALGGPRHSGGCVAALEGRVRCRHRTRRGRHRLHRHLEHLGAGDAARSRARHAGRFPRRQGAGAIQRRERRA